MSHANGGRRPRQNESAAPKGGASQPSKSSRRLEPKADAGGGGPVIAIDVAVSEAAIRCRVEGTDIGIPLRQETPVKHPRYTVKEAWHPRVGGRTHQPQGAA